MEGAGRAARLQALAGLGTKRPSPLSAAPAMSPPLMYRRPWPRPKFSLMNGANG